MAMVKHIGTWQSLFVFILASSFFLLAGSVSPALTIILVLVALKGAEVSRRLFQKFLGYFLFPLQRNLSQLEQEDQFQARALELKSKNIKSKISEARRELYALSSQIQ